MDLQNFEAAIAKNTKLYISEAVDPLKSDIFDIKERAQKAGEKWNTDALSLELRMGKIESNPGGSSADTPQTNKVVKDLQNAMEKLDPVFRRAAFIGWPENASAEKREEVMRKIGKDNYPGFNPTDVGHDFTGPYGNNRKMTSSSWIEFSNIDAANFFITVTNQCDQFFS